MLKGIWDTSSFCFGRNCTKYSKSFSDKMEAHSNRFSLAVITQNKRQEFWNWITAFNTVYFFPVIYFVNACIVPHFSFNLFFCHIVHN